MVAVLVLVLSATAAAVVFRSGDDDPSAGAWRDPEVERASRDLTTAAAWLAESPATHYTGTLTVDGDTISVDARLTNEGSTLATLTVDGTTAELLLVGDSAFVRAGAAFWQARGAPRENVGDYAVQWVKVPFDFFGVDLGLALAPQLLAEAIDPSIAEDAEVPPTRASPGAVTTVNGAEAQAVTANGFTLYVTTATPKRIVRITTAGAPSPAPTVTVTGTVWRTAVAPADALQLDVAELTAEQLDEFDRLLKERIQQLRNAVDSQVRFSLSGSVTLAPCTTRGCQANVVIRNQVRSNSPYLQVNKPVRATITISMTLDGRPIHTCVQERTMPPNGSATASCYAAYYIPPSRNPRVHTIRAVARAVARALVDADLKKFADDLAEELARSKQRKRDRDRSPDPSRTPRRTATSPPTSPPPSSRSAPPCNDPPDGSRGGGPGKWQRVNRGNHDALWKRYQEQITGVKRGKEYLYNGVEYDGFSVVNGRYVFIEAKSRWYAGAFRDATFDARGNLNVPPKSFAEKQLNKRIEQLRRQLNEIRQLPGARLRYVMAEEEALQKLRAYANQQLTREELDRIDWEHVDNDFTFNGCP